MRPIKFRYVYRPYGTNKIIIVHYTLEQLEELTISKSKYIADPSYELISRDQLTGRYDKDGKEIYEGDILNIPSTGYDVKEYNHRVIWNEYTLTYEGITKSGRVYELWYDEELEVIGNIYENPEYKRDFFKDTKGE